MKTVVAWEQINRFGSKLVSEGFCRWSRIWILNFRWIWIFHFLSKLVSEAFFKSLIRICLWISKKKKRWKFEKVKGWHVDSLELFVFFVSSLIFRQALQGSVSLSGRNRRLVPDNDCRITDKSLGNYTPLPTSCSPDPKPGRSAVPVLDWAV